ncbi:MAG: hypothetical protein RLZZ555_649 [Pseudomonadota bacterium]|jgi:16S rRNA (cytosine967-C5)-methyltransferase
MHPKALLDHCAELIALTLTFAHPADATVSQYCREQRSLGSRERPLLADAVYALLRDKPLLEWLLRRLPAPRAAQPSPQKAPRPAKGARPAPAPSAKARALALLALRQQAEFLAQAATPDELAWLEACRSLEANPPADQPAACRHGLPDWLAAALQAELGEEFDALARSLKESAPLDLRVNLLKAKRNAVQRELADAGIASEPTPYSPWGLRLQGKPALQQLALFKDGSIEVQDEGSQLLALLLDAKRNEMVVDFCAGAGGKTLAIGAQMRNTGRLYAFDNSAHRLEGLQPRLQRSGLSNVHPMAIAHERDARLDRLAGKMDRVLVDAPCSGLGTLRRSPDLKWRQDEAGIAEVAALQGRILASAARLVKPGGRLVYATCSLLREENEAVAAAFGAAQGREFVPVPVAELLDRVGVEAAASLVRGDYLRLWPHRHGSDGFFAAVWQRRG